MAVYAFLGPFDISCRIDKAAVSVEQAPVLNINNSLPWLNLKGKLAHTFSTCYQECI